jgi:hypothetical protein
MKRKKQKLTLCALTVAIGGFAQGWIGGTSSNSLVAYNSTLGLTTLNVGIGTTNPTAQLHTTGTVRFTGVVANNAQNRILVQDGNGNVFYRDLNSINANNWSVLGNLGTNPATNFLGTTDNQRLVFRTNNTEKMTITPTGQVGIGTNTPNANLSFGATTPNTNRLYLWDGTNNDKFGFGIQGNTLQIYSGAASASTSLGTNITFGNYNGTTFVEYMRLRNGNLGIGTNAPTAQLHTTSGVRFQGISQDNTQTRIMAQDANGNVVWRDAATLVNTPSNVWNLLGNTGTNPANHFVGTTDNQRLVFRTNNTEKMTITPTGQLGVGTNAPTAQLHTTAGVRFQGISQDNTQNRIMAQDANGNVVWRDASTLVAPPPSNAWNLLGNAGTNPANDFVGTTDNQRLVFRTNNTEKMTITPTGQVGIETSTPNANLSFGATTPNTNRLYLWDGTNNDKFGFGIQGNTLQIYSGAASALTPLGTNITFGNYDGTTFIEYMRLKNGNLGIGTSLDNNPNNYKLAVNGTIGAKAINIENTSTTWPDYVFEKEYNLKTIQELESFINENKHLPNVPSAQEVNEKGVNVVNMDAALLEKIEELSLYIIEQNKKIEQQNARLQALENK